MFDSLSFLAHHLSTYTSGIAGPPWTLQAMPGLLDTRTEEPGLFFMNNCYMRIDQDKQVGPEG